MELQAFSQEAQNFQHGSYCHYKGGKYQTLFVARHSETCEEMLVYQDVLDPEKVWCRPLALFLEHVDVDGEMISRFTKVS